MRRRSFVLITLSLALGACGSSPVVIGDAPFEITSAPARPAEGSGTTTASAAPSPFPTTPPPAGGVRPASRRDGTGFGAGPGERNNMPLHVELSRRCVQPGQEMQATAVTLPSSKLAFAAAYADNSIVPDFTYTPAESNPTGTFTWTWVIRPTIPPGEALVSVVAAKGDRGASFDAPFVVARTC